MSYKIFEHDPGLLPYKADIEQRMKNYENKKRELVGTTGSLCDFANGHEYFGFHKNYISAMIKEYTGMPLHRYLNRVRISHALDMLNDGDIPIGEIARLCGFCDIYYFSRYFKSAVGVSPSEYRRTR